LVEYIELLGVVIVTLALVKYLPTRWLSREEAYRHESKKRIIEKLRK